METKTKKQEALDQLKDRSLFTKLGSFINEFGEEYIVYKYSVGDHSSICITGDELDWDLGLVVAGSAKYAFRPFYFTREESDNIKKIVLEKDKPER